jgi:tetratricopeptide (TPR) repeat protein
MVEEEVARQPVTGLAPPHPAHLVLAAFFADAGQAVRAQAFMSQYLRDAPASRPGRSLELPPSFYAARGAIALAGRRHAEAVQALQTEAGSADQPGLLARTFRLGLALERVGARDSAIAVYERVVEAAGEALVRADAWALPYAMLALGDLLEARGDSEKAAVYFRQFVELWGNADPELQPEVAEVRAKLSGDG